MSSSSDDRAAKRWSELREAATRLDSDPRLIERLRRVRQRLPGDDKFGDPLSVTGQGAPAYLARGLAALRNERESLAGEVSLAGLQLWQSLSEATGRGRGDRPLALLYTDLVDFSAWALKAGDEQAIRLLTDVTDALEVTVNDHCGRVAKWLGDGLIATFLDVTHAVQAGLTAHDGVEAVEVEGYRPRLRAGVHWGRPRKLGGDYVGIDLSLVAAVGESARAGQVLVSAPALEQLDPVPSEWRVGRRKRLRRRRSTGELHVATVRRRRDGKT